MTREPLAFNHLPRPELSWEDDSPTASAFGDIYFNPEDGLAETRHVFLAGTHLTQAWQETPQFTIGELGFGTGLNVLAAWQLWRKHKPAGGHLHILSVEGFPLDQQQLERAHAAFPEFEDMARRLRETLPPRALGHHLLALDEDVTLHLLYGEAAQVLSRLNAKVDAWFLDGFAPAKNEAMWDAHVMAEIARLSRPGTRAATFTVAGSVRRALAEVGFEVEKTPGFGRKRHMLEACFTGKQSTETPPWLARAKPCASKQVAVIGAGIAGTCLGGALTRAGFNPVIFDAASGPARGSSSTPAGIVIPRLTAEADANARFYAAAFHQAVKLYTQAGVISCRGALRLPRQASDSPRLARTLETGLFDPATTHLLGSDEASAMAATQVETAALYLKEAGAVDSAKFLVQAQADLDVRYDMTIRQVVREDDRWFLLGTEDQVLFEADTVVVAAGMASLSLLSDLELPLVARNGQIAKVSAPHLKIPVAYGGYAVPCGDETAWVGTTHDRTTPDAEPLISSEANEAILRAVHANLPNISGTAEDVDVLESWSGIRATSPDFVPVAGPVPDRADYLRDFDPLKHGVQRDLKEATYRPDLFVLTGLGSRGFVTAPLLAEFIAAQLAGTPLPVDLDVAHILHPGRFLIRGLIRGQTSNTSTNAPADQPSE